MLASQPHQIGRDAVGVSRDEARDNFVHQDRVAAVDEEVELVRR